MADNFDAAGSGFADNNSVVVGPTDYYYYYDCSIDFVCFEDVGIVDYCCCSTDYSFVVVVVGPTDYYDLGVNGKCLGQLLLIRYD